MDFVSLEKELGGVVACMLIRGLGGVDIWLRVLDTSKKFQIDAMDQVPIKFRTHAVGAQEVSGGDLWAYKGTIYQPAGSLGSNFSMEK